MKINYLILRLAKHNFKYKFEEFIHINNKIKVISIRKSKIKVNSPHFEDIKETNN